MGIAVVVDVVLVDVLIDRFVVVVVFLNRITITYLGYPADFLSVCITRLCPESWVEPKSRRCSSRRRPRTGSNLDTCGLHSNRQFPTFRYSLR